MHRFMLYASTLNSAWVAFVFLLSPTIFLVCRKKKSWRNLAEQRITLKRKDFKVNSYSLALGQEIACNESSPRKGDMVTKCVPANLLLSLFMAFHKVPSCKMTETPHLYSIKIK